MSCSISWPSDHGMIAHVFSPSSFGGGLGRGGPFNAASANSMVVRPGCMGRGRVKINSRVRSSRASEFVRTSEFGLRTSVKIKRPLQSDDEIVDLASVPPIKRMAARKEIPAPFSVCHRQTQFAHVVNLLRRWAVPNVKVIGRRAGNSGSCKIRAVEIRKPTVTSINGKKTILVRNEQPDQRFVNFAQSSINSAEG